MTSTARLAAAVASVSFEDLPTEVVERTKLLIVDALVCGVAGASFGPACPETLRSVLSTAGQGRATVLGRAGGWDAADAAFANGATVHALNFDALGPAGSHLGLAAVPAPLAAAQAAGASGRDLLVACGLAAEVTARLATALSSTQRPVWVLPGQLLAYPGATLGAARAAGLPADAVHSALGLASMQMAGSMAIMRAGDAPAKALYGAFPSSAAVTSARLAAGGVDARCDAIGGESGLLSVFAPGADAEEVVANFGRTWSAGEVQFKTWPTSAHAHPYIEAALAARQAHAAADIDEILIGVTAAERAWVEPAEARLRPANPAAAANSIPFAVAVALAHGDVRLGHVTARGLRDERVLALTARTRCEISERRGVTVRAVGSTTTHNAVLPPLGSVSRPLSAAGVLDKAVACVEAAGVGAQAVDRLAAVVGEVDQAGGLSRLTDALTDLVTSENDQREIPNRG